jgi:prepilin-type processing-associated H-X9-DG protein
MGLAFKMFANESKGEKFPGRFIDYKGPANPGDMRYWSVPNHVAYHPEYLPDLGVLACPSDSSIPPADFLTKPNTGYWRLVSTTWCIAQNVTPGISASKLAAEPVMSIACDLANNPGDTDNGCKDRTQPQHCYIRYLDDSYEYWGWAIQGKDVATIQLMVDLGKIFDDDENSITATVGADPITTADYGKDIDRTTANGDITFHVLREGIERFFITDINNPAASNVAQSELAILWDASRVNSATDDDPPLAVSPEFNHVPGGGNVLFADGHVEFAKYPQENGSKLWMLTQVGFQDDNMWFP